MNKSAPVVDLVRPDDWDHRDCTHPYRHPDQTTSTVGDLNRCVVCGSVTKCYMRTHSMRACDFVGYTNDVGKTAAPCRVCTHTEMLPPKTPLWLQVNGPAGVAPLKKI